MRLQKNGAASAGRLRGRISPLQICAFVYLYLPILLFLILWIRPLFAALALLGLFAAVLFALRDRQNSGIPEDRAAREGRGRRTLLPGRLTAFVMLLAWCVLSGLGGFTRQSLDWEKHNFILRLLTENSWPVVTELNGERGMLVYYVAGYLVPAVIGRLFGSFRAAELAMLGWSFLGLVLVLLVLCRALRLRRCRDVVLLSLSMMLFSTFLTPVAGIYANLVPGDSGTGEQWYWLSTTYPVQFSSNMMLLRWVSPQAVSGWLLTAALLTERKKIENWGLLLIPAVLYSTFVFVGLGMLMLSFVIGDAVFLRREGKAGAGETLPAGGTSLLKRILDVRNLCAILPLLVLVLFILSSMLQPKPGYSGMAFSLMHYRGKGIIAFFCLNLTWGMWALLLAKRESRNPELWSSAAVLLVLSLLRMGDWNDLCMRASIPALFVFCVLLARQLADVEAGKWYRLLLFAALLLCAVSSLHELGIVLRLYGLHAGNGYPVPADTAAFIGDSLQHKYQYFNWELDGLLHLLARGL